jgi:uncharacterized protein (DUF58 family)
VLFTALLFFGGYWAFVFYVALAAVGLAWLMTYRASSRLVVERYCSHREAEIGADIEVRVRLTNRGLLPMAWLLVEDVATPEIRGTGLRGELTWLGPGRDLLLDYHLRPARRGYYRVGPLFIETGDYFGILRRFVARPPLHYLTVYPEVLPIGRLLVPTSRPVGEVRAPWAVIEDVTRPAGVREYQRGDPMRRIHWKATAHTGRLHSRVYEYTRLQGANLVVNFHRDAWRGEDGEEAAELAVTVAASIAAHLRERHQQFGLVSNGLDGAKMIEAWPAEIDVPSRQKAAEILARREPPERYEPVVVTPGRGEETLQLVLGALARLQPGTGLTLGELVHREHPAWPRELAALLIVPRLDEEVLEAVGMLRAARFGVAVIVVGEAAAAGPIAHLADVGVRAYVVADRQGVTSVAL